MSFQLNVPPSVVAKIDKTTSQNEAEGEGDGVDSVKKREDWRKLKELEEARKAGTAPAMQDEEGRDINPHIPQYIMQAPWYFGASQATLRHQRQQEEKQKEYSKSWYKRGVKEGSVATKFRKGACENCGAVTHNKKDCLERPRKVGARFSGQDFAPDEYVQDNLELDYDGKRDRWNGYDTTEHKRIVEEFQKIDEAKRVLKAQRMEELVEKGELAPEEAKKAVEDVDDEDEEMKYADDVDMPGQKFETKQRITVRNLRIREDTAKYLYNLDVNSAHYDPKTRSMRQNPLASTGKQPKDLPYAGDNFVRFSGGAMEMAKQQLFAWEAYEKGSDVNLQADPTKLDMLTREYNKKKDEYKTSAKDGILAKYGGQEHLDAPPKHMLLAQSEDYVEYSRHGTVISGQEKVPVKSMYDEDVYINNHTSVWGSYWKDGQWGFKCCHSFIKESYCTGAAGREAEQSCLPAIEAPPSENLTESRLQASDKEKVSTKEEDSEDEEISNKARKLQRRRDKKKRRKQKEKERRKNKKKKKRRSSSSSSDSSSSDSSSDSSSSDSDVDDEKAKKEKRIKKAMAAEEKRLAELETIMTMDERKRPYNITYNFKAPDDDEVEAYQRKRLREDDPMANFT